MGKGKKSVKILVFGLISQIVTLSLGIIIPRLLIVSYGSEINGLLSSIKQIFVYVALLEAGIGTAALQALYDPVGNDNREKVSEIMSATSHYYRRTGILYGLSVVGLAFIYPLIFRSELNTLMIASIILLQGSSGVIRYFFQGKLIILLRVDGKSYITTNIATIVNVATHLVQIVLILCGFNIISVQIAYFVINIAQMIYLTSYIKKYYGWLDLNAKPDYKALESSKSVILHQVSGLVFNNTDVLVLTYFCGLKVVSVYSLYSLIISCVASVIDTICSSVEFLLGQAFHTDREKFLKMQDVYETYYLAISFCFFAITLTMLPSFIQLYSKGVTDINYVDKWLPYLFVVLNILMYARRTSSQIINFAGHFKETQLRSALESVINFGVSLMCVQKIGIYGVLIGTIVALLYRTNDIIIYANIKILGRKPWKTYRRWLINTLLLVSCVYLCRKIIGEADSYVLWLINGIKVSIICFLAFLSVASLCDISSFAKVMNLIKNNMKSKKMKIINLS
ncbi:MAG TPA: sugar isomerase [Terrisporobacter glycolicus]|uniref:lipopolysaccharide biosynthesis protein n=1 Tax=Terrisporobacter TaxID=1505652 RepID=UPI000E8D4798|nr:MULTISPECIES: sugar isomerase [Terrisporobacter]HBI93583.1 sugar isomerase [Terrisporobacter hibernicus]